MVGHYHVDKKTLPHLGWYFWSLAATLLCWAQWKALFNVIYQEVIPSELSLVNPTKQKAYAFLMKRGIQGRSCLCSTWNPLAFSYIVDITHPLLMINTLEVDVLRLINVLQVINFLSGSSLRNKSSRRWQTSILCLSWFKLRSYGVKAPSLETNTIL